MGYYEEMIIMLITDKQFEEIKQKMVTMHMCFDSLADKHSLMVDDDDYAEGINLLWDIEELLGIAKIVK